jgi:small-conductance mechanosensitive channel
MRQFDSAQDRVFHAAPTSRGCMHPGGSRSPGRRAFPILVLVATLLSAPLHAQSTQVTASKPVAAAPISPGQAEQLLDVLNDPKKRAAFTSTLTAMARSLPATAPAPAKIVLAPNSLGRELLGETGAVRALVLTQIEAFGRIFGDMVLATHWLDHELRSPESRGELLDAGWRGSAVILAALLAERGLFYLLRRPLRALARDARVVQEMAPSLVETADGAAPPPEMPVVLPEPELPHEAEKRVRDATHRWRTLRLLRRVPFALLRLLLKLLPVGLFLVIGNVVGGSFTDHPVTQLIIVTITNLYGIGRVLYLALDMLLAPYASGVRLVGVSDVAALLLIRWWAWLVAVPVAAVMVTSVGGILNLPERAAQSIIRAIVLIEHVLLGLLIWRLRHRVATALSPPRRFRTTTLGAVFSRMAENWWIPALFLDFALSLVWAAQVRDGYGRIGRLFLASSLVAFGCRLGGAALLGLLDRLFRIHPELELRYPGLERRANRYYPLLRRVVNAAVLGVGAVVLLQAWGLHALTWFTGGALGTRLVSALISILLALVIGVMVWEAVNAALDRQVSRFGLASQAARAVRLQTLLPILRTILFVVLATIVSLTVLSEIGVNVAPLLAGAGILGVAIGFGSQKLVQDFITGIFLLVENAMQVGDTVTAAGVTGTVEHLSIRTLRLRGGDGSVQIIPFSSVSTVVNLSRDFAVATVAISVAMSEDTDRVCDILNAIGDGLRQDAGFADLILEDFALNGVDSIGEYAVAISGTIKCMVAGRWPVQREFYRRLRMAMHEQHVALPARLLASPRMEQEEQAHG